MAKTLTTLAGDVLDELGEDKTDAALLTQAENWVQRIYDELGSEIDWRFNYTTDTITTVATQAEYDLKVDHKDITSCRVQDSGEIIEYRSRDHMYSHGYDMEDTGAIPLYFYWGAFNTTTMVQKIAFWPIPTTATTVIELNIVGRPTTLASGTNIPVPNEFLSVIHEGALGLGHRHEREWDSFDRTWNLYLTLKAKLVRSYKYPKAGGYRFHPSDVPARSGGMAPVRLPPGRYRNWW
jgi:hypothetical protein